MVHEIQHHSESVPHTGERQLHSELLIMGQLPPNGVAATPKRGEEGLPCTKKPQNDRHIPVNTESPTTYTTLMRKTPRSHGMEFWVTPPPPPSR